MRHGDRCFSTVFSFRFIVTRTRMVCISAIDGTSKFRLRELRSVSQSVSRDAVTASVTMSELCSILSCYCLSIFNLPVMKQANDISSSSIWVNMVVLFSIWNMVFSRYFYKKYARIKMKFILNIQAILKIHACFMVLLPLIFQKIPKNIPLSTLKVEFVTNKTRARFHSFVLFALFALLFYWSAIVIV